MALLPHCFKVKTLYVFLFVQLSSISFNTRAQQINLSPSPSSTSSPSLTPLPSTDTEHSPQASPSSSPFDFSVGRIFSVATDSPIRALLRRDPDFLTGQRHVQSYFEQVENYTRHSLNQAVDTFSGTSMSPCNSDGTNNFFKRAYEVYTEIRRLPDVDTSCLSEYIITNNIESNALGLSLQQLNQAVRNRSKAVFRRRQEIADVVLGNWSKPDAPYDFEHLDSPLVCSVNNVAGVRVGQKWYLRTFITNIPANDNVPEFDRKILYEFHRMESNANELDDSLRLSTYVRPPNNGEGFHRLENDTTTLLEARQGSVLPTSYGRMYYEGMPAVPAAIDLAEQGLQQVNDALAPSSISILVLPLVLNLVPLAALMPTTLVSSKSTFLYTIMTDVLTVIPLVIKGIELIVIGRQHYTTAALRMSAAIDGSLAPSSIAELWTVECRVEFGVIQAGMAFVISGLVSMVLGIWLEIYTRGLYIRRYTVESIEKMFDDNVVGIGNGIGIGDSEEYGDNLWNNEGEQQGSAERRVVEAGAADDASTNLLSSDCDLLVSDGAFVPYEVSGVTEQQDKSCAVGEEGRENTVDEEVVD